MAIVGTDQEEDSNLAQPTTSNSANAHAGQGNAGGGFVGGTGTGSGQGATTGVAASAPNQTPGGGGYANLSQYLQANQGTGATTGQAAENVVQQSGNAAKQAQNDYNTSASNEINSGASGLGVNQNTLGQINSGTQNVSQDYMNQIAKGGYSYTSDQNTLNNLNTASQQSLDSMIAAGKNATGAYGGPTDFSQVQYGGPSYGQTAVSYGGPTSLSGFGGQTQANQANAIQAAGVVAGNVKNAQGGQAGVSALLKNAYQQPNYTAGENSLDSFLAGGTAGGQQALSQAGGVGQDVSNSYSKINDALTGQIQGAQQTAANTNNTYQNAINQATQTSDATRSQYYSAAQAAKDKALADQKAAQADAGKAQAQENGRAITAAEAASAAKAEADKKAAAIPIQPPQPTPIQPQPTQEKNTSLFNQTVNDFKNTPQAIGALPGQFMGALGGNQKDKNALATDLLTGGLNVAMPSAVKAATTAGKNVVNTAQNLGGKAASAIKKFHFSDGGEVPSYSQILNMLKGK